MATDTNSTSLIFALHTRYEQLWNENHAIEDAKLKIPHNLPSLSPLFQRKFQLENAEKRNSSEEVALNEAILHQVPTTWEEALILATHLKIAGIEENSERGDTRQKAVEDGFDTLLDFLFSEINHDTLPCVGPMLLSIANLVYDRRRLRTGKVEA
jgi:hypothetical protein